MLFYILYPILYWEIRHIVFQDQERRIRELGGRKNILATENYDHTPVIEEYGQ